MSSVMCCEPLLCQHARPVVRCAQRMPECNQCLRQINLHNCQDALSTAPHAAWLGLPQDYQRLLASAPTRRLNPAKLVESGVLKNKLVDTISFLENLAVKDSAEKDMFFKRLPSAVPQLPQPVAQLKLLPMLAGAALDIHQGMPMLRAMRRLVLDARARPDTASC